MIDNSLSNTYIVYMDAKLFKKGVIKQIIEFLRLDFDEVIWKKDPRYKIYTLQSEKIII